MTKGGGGGGGGDDDDDAEDEEEEEDAASEEEGEGVASEEGGVLFGTVVVGANCLLRALRAALAGAPASRDRCST